MYRRLECHATHNQRRHAFGSDPQAFGVQRNIDTAGIPKTRMLIHILIVRGIDEDLQIDACPFRFQLIGDNRPDLDPAIKKRRSKRWQPH